MASRRVSAPKEAPGVPPEGPNGPFRLETELTPQGDQPEAITELSRRVAAGERFVTLLGVTGSGKTFTMAHAIQTLQRPTLVISPNKTLAAQLVSEFRALFPNNAVEYFVSYYDYYQPEAYVPQIDLYIEKDASINEEIDRLRHRATQALLTRRDVVIVASVSCIYGLGSPEDYRASVVEIVRGEEVGRQELLARLVRMKYDRNDTEFRRGRFRVRGGTIDVMDAGETIHRIALEGRRVESIVEIDPVTGDERRELDRLLVFPATHFLTVHDRLEAILQAIDREKEARVKELLREERVVEAQRLKSRTEYDLEMIRETGYCAGIENYARYFSGRGPGEPPYTLLDFFPKDLLVFLDESHVTVPQLGGMFKGDHSRKANLVEYGFRLPSALDNRPLKFAEFEAVVRQTVFVSATPAEYEARKSGQVVEQVVRPTGLVDPPVEVRPASTQVDDLMSEIGLRVKKNERVLVTTLTKRMAEELTEYLDEHGVKVRYLHSEIETVERVEIIRDLRLGEFDVLVGINLLREGLDLPEVSLVAILDADKEGFLRSERSLIQTVGRAARHINGRAILYADRVTDSMKRAIAETDRRRGKQIAFNAKHKITPVGVQKRIKDLIDGVYDADDSVRLLKAAEEGARYEAMSEKQLARQIKALEKQMLDYARNLEFEKAAKARDDLATLRKRAFGVELHSE